MYISKPKAYIIQYTIPELKVLSRQKYIRYKGRLLIVDHLIDLLHPFYEKAIRHELPVIENSIPNNSRFCISVKLNSRIMLGKYGRHYTAYIDYLIENKYIKLSRNYHSNKRSKTYELILKPNESLNVEVYKNYDSSKHKRLLKYYNEEVNLIPQNIRIEESVFRQTIDNLHHVSIDERKAITILKTIYSNENSNKYYRNNYCIKTISNKQIYIVADDYGRIHTNFTVLKKEIRNDSLMIDGEEIYERDVRNSQPFFLLKLMADNLQYFSDAEEDLKRYYDLVSTGFFYEEVNKIFPNKSREDVKKWIMMVFFNKNYFQDKRFQKAFSSVFGFIKNYKKKHGYKSLAHRLQNIESDFIFGKVCSKLIENEIRYFTVHDSVYVKDSEKTRLNEIFDNEFNLYLHNVARNLFPEKNIYVEKP